MKIKQESKDQTCFKQEKVRYVEYFSELKPLYLIFEKVRSVATIRRLTGVVSLPSCTILRPLFFERCSCWVASEYSDLLDQLDS